jgi:hypothetical protein
MICFAGKKHLTACYKKHEIQKINMKFIKNTKFLKGTSKHVLLAENTFDSMLQKTQNPKNKHEIYLLD